MTDLYSDAMSDWVEPCEPVGLDAGALEEPQYDPLPWRCEVGKVNLITTKIGTDMSDELEDMSVVEELALACEAADSWFRKHHDAFRPLPNHHVVWLQLGKAVTRYNTGPDPPLEDCDFASWDDDPGY